MIINGIETKPLKANLHTHSTTSDGRFTPQTIARIFRDAGYDVLALSDHCAPNDVSTVNVPGLTMVSGIELHPWGPDEKMWHILALGVPKDFCGQYETGQEAVKAAKAVGALVYCAHPYWVGNLCHEIIGLGDIDGIEVFNTGCRLIGKQYNMQIWDELLDAGMRPCMALANDDCHGWLEFGQGWNMIGALERSEEGVLEALRAGRYYATQGPEFSIIECRDRRFHAEFSEAVSAFIISNREQGTCVRSPRSPLPGHEPPPVTSLDVDLSDYAPGSYVRGQITDAQGRMAWTQPFFL